MFMLDCISRALAVIVLLGLLGQCAYGIWFGLTQARWKPPVADDETDARDDACSQRDLRGRWLWHQRAGAQASGSEGQPAFSRPREAARSHATGRLQRAEEER